MPQEEQTCQARRTPPTRSRQRLECCSMRRPQAVTSSRCPTIYAGGERHRRRVIYIPLVWLWLSETLECGGCRSLQLADACDGVRAGILDASRRLCTLVRTSDCYSAHTDLAVFIALSIALISNARAYCNVNNASVRLRKARTSMNFSTLMLDGSATFWTGIWRASASLAFLRSRPVSSPNAAARFLSEDIGGDAGSDNHASTAPPLSTVHHGVDASLTTLVPHNTQTPPRRPSARRQAPHRRLQGRHHASLSADLPCLVPRHTLLPYHA